MDQLRYKKFPELGREFGYSSSMEYNQKDSLTNEEIFRLTCSINLSDVPEMTNQAGETANRLMNYNDLIKGINLQKNRKYASSIKDESLNKPYEILETLENLFEKSSSRNQIAEYAIARIYAFTEETMEKLGKNLSYKNNEELQKYIQEINEVNKKLKESNERTFSSLENKLKGGQC